MNESKSPAMTTASASTGPESDQTTPARPLSPAAQRALAEAEERRRQRAAEAALPPERGGRAGPDPVRYGDWENGGIASDF